MNKDFCRRPVVLFFTCGALAIATGLAAWHMRMGQLLSAAERRWVDVMGRACILERRDERLYMYGNPSTWGKSKHSADHLYFVTDLRGLFSIRYCSDEALRSEDLRQALRNKLLEGVPAYWWPRYGANFPVSQEEVAQAAMIRDTSLVDAGKWGTGEVFILNAFSADGQASIAVFEGDVSRNQFCCISEGKQKEIEVYSLPRFPSDLYNQHEGPDCGPSWLILRVREHVFLHHPYVGLLRLVKQNETPEMIDLQGCVSSAISSEWEVSDQHLCSDGRVLYLVCSLKRPLQGCKPDQHPYRIVKAEYSAVDQKLKGTRLAGEIAGGQIEKVEWFAGRVILQEASGRILMKRVRTAGK